CFFIILFYFFMLINKTHWNHLYSILSNLHSQIHTSIWLFKLILNFSTFFYKVIFLGTPLHFFFQLLEYEISYQVPFVWKDITSGINYSYQVTKFYSGINKTHWKHLYSILSNFYYYYSLSTSASS